MGGAGGDGGGFGVGDGDGDGDGAGLGGSALGHASRSATSMVKSGELDSPIPELVDTAGVVEPSSTFSHSPSQPVRLTLALKTSLAETFTEWLAL